MVFGKVKEVLDAKEAEFKGEKWLAQVKSSDGQWKGLEEWKSIYEPDNNRKDPKGDPEPAQGAAKAKKIQGKALDAVVEKAKAKTQEKALDGAFELTEKGLSKALFRAMLEVASTLLGKASQVAKEQTPTMSAVLSSSNAIILSYRFGSSSISKRKSNKFAYFRKVACHDLTQILHTVLADKDTKKISGELLVLFEQQKRTTRANLLQKVDLLLATADSQIDAAASDVQGRVGQMKVHSEAVMEVVGATGIVPGGNIRAAKAQAEAKTSRVVPDKDALKGRKDDVVVQFGSMFRELLVSKTEQLDTFLRVYIDKFIEAVEMAIKLQGALLAGAKKKSPEELTDDMVNWMDTQYKDAQERIAAEVRKVLRMIRAMAEGALAEEEETETGD